MAEVLPSTLASVRIVRSVVVSTLAAIIIFGNLLVLIILPRVKSCKGNPRLFLTSLTMADLMAGIFVAIPMAISSAADKWIFGGTFCNFLAGARLVFNIGALLSLLAVTVDRYIAIAYPLRYREIVTKRRSICTVVGIWILGILFTFGYGPLFDRVPARYFSHHCLCFFTSSDVEEFDWTLIFCLSLFVVTPFIVTTIIYTRLFYIVKRHKVFMRQNADSKSTKNFNFLITFFLVILYFAIAWVPMILVRLIELLVSDFSTPKPVNVLFEVLVLMNNGINVFTYYFRNKDFKRAAIKVLCIKSEVTRDSKTDSSSLYITITTK